MELTKHEYGLVTPVMAEEYLKHVDAEFQRPLSETHVLHLARLIDDGIFLSGYLVFASVEGKTYCANGQHTANAIVKANKPVRCLAEWYRLKDLAEYVRLFHAFDTESRRRTSSESAQAFLMGRKSSLPDVSVTTLNNFRMGVDFAAKLSGGRKFRVTQYERFDAVVELRDELDTFLWLDRQKADIKLLNRAPVIAAVVNTYAANPQRCREFWRQVVSGFFNNQSDDDPCVKLNRFLLQNNVWSGEGVTTKGSMTRKEMYIACIHAWNAYVNGKSLRQIRTTSSNNKSVPQVAA